MREESDNAIFRGIQFTRAAGDEGDCTGSLVAMPSPALLLAMYT